MIKRIFPIIFIVFAAAVTLSAQTVSQIGFVVKTALPDTENIAVICHDSVEPLITKQAKTAFLITRKRYHVYTVKSRTDLPKVLTNVRRLKKLAVILITDSSSLNARSVKYIAQKLGMKRIPVASNRPKDSHQGALLCVVETDGNIKTHVNKIVASALKLNLPEAFLAKSIIDVE